MLFTGCGIFQKNRSLHYDSCGPDALYDAMIRLDFRTSKIRISKEILKDQKCYSLLREVLAIFDSQAKEITFPQEIKDHLRKNGIKVTVLHPSEFASLTYDKTAIVLVHQKNTLNYHWACFPAVLNLSSFYGEGVTTIERLFLLERL